MKIKNRKTRIIGVVVLIILIIVVLFVRAHIRIQNGDLVKWEGKWYTKEEIKATFPPQYIEVPAKNTPEEVYATFRQALLDNDIETALGEIKDSEREKYQKVFSDPELLKKYQTIPEVGQIKQIKEETYGNFTTYFYFKNIDQKNYREIDLQKNPKGYWQIKII
ncbi:hypothetical protein KKD51_01525 [Patescibacteria group bacterium]|nr:hypothetical protein [Patescibacteria group bacterium]